MQRGTEARARAHTQEGMNDLAVGCVWSPAFRALRTRVLWREDATMVILLFADPTAELAATQRVSIANVGTAYARHR